MMRFKWFLSVVSFFIFLPQALASDFGKKEKDDVIVGGATGTLLVTGLEYGSFVGGTTHIAGVSSCMRHEGSCDKYIWIHNIGNTPVYGVYGRLENVDPQLSITRGSCDTPTTLDPGESCYFRLRFDNPNYIRYYGERLIIEKMGNVTVLPSGDNLPTCGAEFKCNGRSFDPVAQLTMSGDGLEAGGSVGGTSHIAAVSQTDSGTRGYSTINLQNTGSYSVSNLDVFLVDENDNVLSMSDNCPSVFFPGSSCQINLKFNNTNYIRYYGSRLVITGNEMDRDLEVLPSGNNLPTCGAIYNCNGS